MHAETPIIKVESHALLRIEPIQQHIFFCLEKVWDPSGIGGCPHNQYYWLKLGY